jgi:hypothetical protein
VLCKMRIAPDLQSDLNVRRAYTFLDIWVTDLGHFPMRWRAMSEEVSLSVFVPGFSLRLSLVFPGTLRLLFRSSLSPFLGPATKVTL